MRLVEHVARVWDRMCNPAGRNLAKFEVRDFYECLSKKKLQIWFKIGQKISDTLHEDMSTFYC
jgi:hypothetical protein